ncbi:hypothetical protein H0H87_006595 [Tephrocybe sp. NHM501043]|nr:hypothetical protein H0H87_006595 [Tephrocybe sp. NHM501043]
MVRATTRSQGPSANSQAQGRPSQTQRARQAIDHEEEEGGSGDDDGDDDGDMDVDEGDLELKRKAHNLARLALFAEQRRTPLRREDISKKVMGQNSRAFNHIFKRAQDILQKTFGMELVELQTRAGLETDTTRQYDDRNATGIKKKVAALGSKTYILRSVLHPVIIEHAALTDEQILEDEADDAPSDDDNDDDDSYAPQFYGSLISWSSADQLGALGILYTILALILVSGRVISDSELRAHLKRLSLPQTGVVYFTARSTHPTQSVETYLSTLIRQGYLDRVQVGDTKKGGKGKGAKRARVTQADDDNLATYEWRWGNRSQSEVGEKAVAKFVAEFMIGDADEDEEGAQSRQDAGSKLERMTKGIERAAGGHLTDIK